MKKANPRREAHRQRMAAKRARRSRQKAKAARAEIAAYNKEQEMKRRVKQAAARAHDDVLEKARLRALVNEQLYGGRTDVAVPAERAA